jgi:glycosyltransferase involved in cell wall biosynthesis
MSQIEQKDIFVSLVTVVGSNNTPSLPKLIRETVHELETRYSNFELIVVDNGLRSDIFKTLTAQLSELPCIRIIKLAQIRDFDTATFSGIEAAIGDYVSFFEIEVDPLQEPYRLIDRLLAGADLVQGMVNKTTGSFFRKVSRNIFFGISKFIAGLEISPRATYLTAFSRPALNAIVSSPTGLKYLRHLIGHIGFEIVEHDYERPEGVVERDRPGFTAAIEVLTNYSLRPLRVVSGLGLIAAFVNFSYTIYVLVTFISTKVAQGWASTNLQLGIMFFLLFLSLSLISEYLGRILSESQRQSSYIIKDELVSSRLISNENRRNIA